MEEAHKQRICSAAAASILSSARSLGGCSCIMNASCGFRSIQDRHCTSFMGFSMERCVQIRALTDTETRK